MKFGLGFFALLFLIIPLLVIVLIIFILPNKRQSQSKIQDSTTANSTSAADVLIEFKELLDQGAITQKEYDDKKKELLNL